MRKIRKTALVLCVATIAGCSDGPTEPDVVFEVIEETEFAPSLGVDLGTMQRLSSGVYVKDLVEGTGAPAVFGANVVIEITGWLTNGTQWLEGTEQLLLGNTPTIGGLEDALLNMRVGGVRQAIIPPSRGYGAAPQHDPAGNVVVPPGSVLVFEIELQVAVE